MGSEMQQYKHKSQFIDGLFEQEQQLLQQQQQQWYGVHT